MTPTRQLLEAALEGYDIQRKAIEAKQAEIREALKSPVDVMQVWNDRERMWDKEIFSSLSATGLLSKIEKQTRVVPEPVSAMDRIGSAIRKRLNGEPKRKMSAAGRAAISKATKLRWAKYRKEHKRA